MHDQPTQSKPTRTRPTKAAAAANLRRRGNAWEVYWRIKGVQHSETFPDRKYGNERASRDAAQLSIANRNLERARGELRAPQRITFEAFTQEWLTDYAKAHVRGATYTGYESVLRVHLVPHFGGTYLTEITTKAIDSFVADWVAGGPSFQARLKNARAVEANRARAKNEDPRNVWMGKAPKTIANSLVPLREMLGHAVKWGYLTSNPAIGVRRPRVESRHDEMRALDAAEVKRLLEKAPADGYALLLTTVTTGLRRGEILGLRWGDIDWNSKRLRVRRSVTLDGKFQTPKTAGSVRAVGMTATLIATLREHRMASSFKGEDDLVFPSEKGTPLDGGNMVKRYLSPALRKAGLGHVRFHDLRHTYASLLIAQGAHPKLISEQLGHASVQITMDRYGHLMDQSYGDATDQLEAALFGEPTPIAAAG